MLRLLAILALRAMRMSDRNKAFWHGAHAFFAAGELAYHGVLALFDARDARRRRR